MRACIRYSAHPGEAASVPGILRLYLYNATKILRQVHPEPPVGEIGCLGSYYNTGPWLNLSNSSELRIITIYSGRCLTA